MKYTVKISKILDVIYDLEKSKLTNQQAIYLCYVYCNPFCMRDEISEKFVHLYPKENTLKVIKDLIYNGYIIRNRGGKLTTSKKTNKFFAQL